MIIEARGKDCGQKLLSITSTHDYYSSYFIIPVFFPSGHSHVRNSPVIKLHTIRLHRALPNEHSSSTEQLA